MAEKGYRFLKISARVFNVLAWLALGVGVVVSVINLVSNADPWAPRAGKTVLAVMLGCLYFFIFGTVSGLIHLLLDIESKIKS